MKPTFFIFTVVCVPGMGIWYLRYQIIPEGVTGVERSHLVHGFVPRSTSKSQGLGVPVGYREVLTEGSEAACNDGKPRF
ncbi:MAG: hypothetical protein RIF40_28060 [Imperialibacter sp.]